MEVTKMAELPVSARNVVITCSGIPGAEDVTEVSSTTTSCNYNPYRQSGGAGGGGWTTWTIGGAFETTPLTVSRQAQAGNSEWYDYAKEHMDATKIKDEGAKVTIDWQRRDGTSVLAITYESLSFSTYTPPNAVGMDTGGNFMSESLEFNVGKLVIAEMK
jgi:hypothetical protein